MVSFVAFLGNHCWVFMYLWISVYVCIMSIIWGWLQHKKGPIKNTELLKVNFLFLICYLLLMWWNPLYTYYRWMTPLLMLISLVLKWLELASNQNIYYRNLLDFSTIVWISFVINMLYGSLIFLHLNLIFLDGMIFYFCCFTKQPVHNIFQAV